MTYLKKVEKAKNLINETLKTYKSVVVANSFGKDSMVVTHLAQAVYPRVRIISVLTPFKFEETFKYKDRMVDKYNMNATVVVREDGPKFLWKKDPDACCQHYKVEPMKELLKNVDAWICGLRRTEGQTRTNFQFIEEKDGLIKVNPILDFTELDVWRYLAINGIPVNPIYARGYRSLGCEPCSSPEKDEGETERMGRWFGTKKCGGECGIHSQPMGE